MYTCWSRKRVWASRVDCVADMVCGRYGHGLWPILSVADIFLAEMVVADMVCGRYRRPQNDSITYLIIMWLFKITAT